MRWLGLIFGLMALIVAPTVTRAQGGDVVWNVAYYANAYLIGEAAITTELRGRITQDFGAGSPGDGIPADFFSARYGTNTYFTAGTYRFSALADDGVSVTVDSQPIINTFEAGSPAENLVGEVTLTEGFHNVQVDYREAEGAAYVYVSWDRLGNTQPAPFPEPSSAIATEGRWLAEFYNNTTLTPPVAFANETPSPVADWGTDAPVSEVNAEGWSARFTTSFFLNEGRYRATLRADDGVRFYVNGRLLIDQFGSTGGRAFDVEFDVGSGDQTFIIEHVEYGGTAFLRYSLARVLGTTETFVGNAGTLPQFVPTPISLTGTTSSIAPAPTSVPQVTTTDVTATVTARYINVRAEPRVARGNIVSTASSGQTFPVIGRANNGWVQLQVNGVTGWVNGRYVSAPNLLSVPITGQGPTS